MIPRTAWLNRSSDDASSTHTGRDPTFLYALVAWDGGECDLAPTHRDTFPPTPSRDPGIPGQFHRFYRTLDIVVPLLTTESIARRGGNSDNTILEATIIRRRTRERRPYLKPSRRWTTHTWSPPARRARNAIELLRHPHAQNAGASSAEKTPCKGI